MKEIVQLTLPNDLNIDVMYANKSLGYTFMHKDEQYGNAVKLPTRKIPDIVAASLLLFTNALELKKKLESDESAA